MELFSARERNKLLINATTWMNLQIMMLGARCLREKKKILSDSIYIKFWKMQINLSCQKEISDVLGMGRGVERTDRERLL